MPRTHWVPRGTGTPKERDEVNRREVRLVVYYESIKRELKTRPMYECRCDERLKTKVEESKRAKDKNYIWISVR